MTSGFAGTYSATVTVNGCTSLSSGTTNVVVNPVPVLTPTNNSPALCSGQNTNISLNADVGGTTFAWTTAVSGPVTGQVASSGSSISQTLSNSGTVNGTVTYTVTPTASGCPGTPVNVAVTVYPVPNATATPSAQTICNGQTTSIALTSAVSGTTFAWTASASSGSIGGFANGNGASIAQTLSNSGSAPGTVTYVITPTANSCPGTTISVVVTVNPTPAVTATPSSQTICAGQSTSIALSSAVSGTTFAWTVSGSTGTGGFTASSGNSIAQTLTNSTTTAGTVTYTVTPTANTCPGSSIQVPITVNPNPDVVATPSSQTICSGQTATINLTSAVSGTVFNWTSSASAGTVTGHAAGTGNTISQAISNSGIAQGTVTYTITPQASSCSSTPITATVNVNPLPNGSIAAVSPVCFGSQTTLTFTFSPGVGPYDITYTDGIGIFTANGISSGATVQHLPPTSVTYSLMSITDVGTGCGRMSGFTGSAAVAVNPLPSVSFSGLAPAYCQTSGAVTLTGNQAPNGSFSGPGITDNGNGTASFNPSVAGVGGPYTVTYSYTDINVCSANSTQTVVVDQQPFANAGTAAIQCDLDVTLAAVPSVGSGLWTSTGPGTAFFNNATNTGSGVQVDAFGTYSFTWTETNGTCSDADQVSVTFTEQPVANAGQGGSACDLDFDLAALASVGNGTWTLSNGPGSASFGNANAAATSVTVLQYGQYTFQWEEVNGTCSDAATVVVNFYQQPVSNAGLGGAECDLDFTLAATPSIGTGTWTSIGPGAAVFAPNANDPNATVTVSAFGNYSFTWTEVNGSCSDASSVSVTFDEATTANAGNGGAECDLTFTFNGTSGLGTGIWSYTGPGNAFFSNNASPTATVTVDADGVYDFTWTQTNGVCVAQDQITLTFYNQPVANAGQGGDACDLDFVFSAVPSYGNGVWTQTGGSGTSSFSDATAPNATATVSQYGTYQFTWTETNGTCSDAASVTVNFYQQPVANPGNGGNECDLDFNLAATASIGTGVWTATGLGTASFGSANSASTTVTVGQYGAYQFTWTETNGTCSDAATVTVNFYQQPTANAGQNGDACVLSYQLGATLSTGTGVWTQTAGSGTATFSNPNSPNATVTVSAYDTYIFTWTETNGTCSDADDVTVNFWNQPVANAGSDMQECDLNVALNAIPSLGSGLWTAVGPGTVSFVSNTSANTTATVTQYGSYTFTWTETNGTCISSDNMVVEFFQQSVANAGQGGNECDLNFTFNATPSFGTGVWTSSGPGTAFFSNVSDAASSVTVSAYGTYTFTWTETNGPCTDAASITVNFYQQPVVNAGVVTDQCDLDFTFNGSASVGTGTWTATGPGNASFSNVNAVNSTVTVSQVGTYNFTWTEVNGTCSDAETVTITFNPLPVVSFSGLAAAYCVSQTSTVSLAGTPAGGQFSGAGIAGSAFIPSVAGVGTHDITYTYTDSNGCTDSETQSVVVNDSPVVLFSGLAAAYCASETTSQPLTGAPTGGTFTGNGISGNGFTPSAAGLGSHFITYDYTDVNGCSGLAQQLVVVNALPVVSFSGLSTAYCADAATVTMVPTPVGGTFSGGGVTGSQFSPSVAGVGAHVVTYTYTDGNGCQNSVTQSVTINALPQPVITPSGTQTICAGTDVSLNAGQGYSIYAWSTNQNGQTISVGTAGSYTVTVTTSAGCAATSAPVQVNVNPLPIVNIGNDTTICQGTFLTLNAGNPGLSYLWSTQENTQQITVGSTGNYTVEVTDGNGCVGTDSRLVAVSSSLNPVIVAQGPTTFCQGESVTLGVQGSYAGYVWSNNAQGPNTTVSSAGPVIVTVTDQFGCTGSSAPVNVVVNQLPNAVIVPSGSTNLCQGASVTLSASNTFSNYLWNPNGQVTPTITVSTAGTYSLTVTDPVNGCVATSNSIVVTQSQGVQPSIVANGPLEFCAGGSVVLTVQPVGAFTSFLWSSGSNTPAITVTETGEYALSVLDANNCLNESLLANPVVVTVWDPQPIVQQQGNTLVVTNGPFSSYQWFLNNNPVPGATADSFTPSQSGNIRVQVTDENGCTGNSLTIEYTSVGIADAQEPYELNVYPNPSGGQFTIEANLGSQTDVTLAVRDVVGRDLMQAERIQGASTFRRTFDISHLANGIYYVQVAGDSGMTVRQLVKQ
jgi:trimeric autotransporter adhesin